MCVAKVGFQQLLWSGLMLAVLVKPNTVSRCCFRLCLKWWTYKTVDICQKKKKKKRPKRLKIELDRLHELANETKMGFITGSGREMLVYIMWANNGGFMWLYDLLGFGGNRVQLLQWMISLISDSSWDTGAGTIPRPGIKGLSGEIPAIIPRLGSKSESKMRSKLIPQIQCWKTQRIQ